MITDKIISNWDPHNLLEFIEHNKLQEFIISDVLKIYSKEPYYHNTYYHTHLVKLCTILMTNNYLSVSYYSEGGKTISKYKYIKRQFNNG